MIFGIGNLMQPVNQSGALMNARMLFPTAESSMHALSVCHVTALGEGGLGGNGL